MCVFGFRYDCMVNFRNLQSLCLFTETYGGPAMWRGFKNTREEANEILGLVGK